MMDTSTSQSVDEYSAASTTIKFDSPIPLLRGPIPAGTPDDPESGPYVLAFGSPACWAAARKRCESLIMEQCEDGARVGCAISASSKCKPPWWQALIGRRADLKEREKCEEREMEACLVAAKDKCVGFAKEKCLRPFMDARIAARKRGTCGQEMQMLICLASMPERSKWRDLIGLSQLGMRFLSKCRIGVTNYKASELLGSDTNYTSSL